MAILSTSFRRPVTPAVVQPEAVMMDVAPPVVEDLAMMDAAQDSTSDDSSGSDSDAAPAARPIHQLKRSAFASFRRSWIPSVGFFFKQSAASSESSTGMSRKRRNSDAEEDMAPSKRMSLYQ